MASKTVGNGAGASTKAQKTNGAVVDPDGVHHEYEFGGPVGVLGMMTFFPCLFYYLYVCLFFYDGESCLSMHRAEEDRA